MIVRGEEAFSTGNASQAAEHAASERHTLLYGVAAMLSLIGLADAIYLTVEHLAGRSVQCTVVSGCSEVLGSAYATVGGFPLASFGALAYFTTFSCATLAAFGYRSARTLLALVVASMLVVALWLLYVQAFVLHAYCAYCLLSAAITLSLAGIVAFTRFARSQKSSDRGNI